jgi:UDP-glucose 4-epimerase
VKVLVTGGAGFIGSHTVVELVLDGHEPVVLDSLANAKRSVMDRVERITGYRVPLVVGDVRDDATLDGVFGAGDIEAVIHFAGLKAVGESVDRPLDYYDVNVTGTVKLLQGMLRHGVSTFVFSSSATVYGDPATVPLPETAERHLPSNPYGRSKLMVEHILEDLAVARTDLHLGALRYFNPVGAHSSGLIGEDPIGIPNNLMPVITQVAVERLPALRVFGGDYDTRDGTCIRDYIHVTDLARGHLAALKFLQTNAGLHVWNLGTGEGTTVLELIDAFQRTTGVRIPHEVVDRRPGDVAATYADPSRAAHELGWRAEHGIDRMCEDAWRWQQHAETLTTE